ncbi:MAG: DUF4910 domain-containing protein [Candidatus Heimdallarchaeum endolithica]|uniref:DUF4910 domain-containing protein n=1 Tax=Candidatus Heimdallarchaeum endolithica TaxID=2876572 RepID=A0A9Y1FME9_9ARCH|nr:MAG: DUF4910 domain-containing protein [Candidatus Heimdallarchaeum endolithica]
MSLENLIKIVSKELSGERAKRYTEKVSNYHRIQASSGFLDAIGFIKSELERIGDKNYKVEEFIADGKKNNYSWYSPISWEINDGFLRMIEPECFYLCRFNETPESIATHSKKTDVKAELVDIEDATNKEILKKENIEGKIVLTSASIKSIKEKIFELGALGVIIYPTEKRAVGKENLIQYVGLWPNEEDAEMTTFGFSISRKQAMMLKNYLKKEKVVLHAKIDSKLYTGKLHVLTTKIDGNSKNDGEIVLIAHICHPYPSANDNASGSGLLLEIFRTLKKLVEKKIVVPKRSIRFLWVPEFNGTIPWIKKQVEEGIWNPVFCINLDMVGEHPGIIGEPFTVSQSSVSIPFFLNDLIAELIEKCKDNPLLIEQSGWNHPWNCRMKPFAGGSDHILFTDEPVRIPSVMFGHEDRFWHTNLDTIEKVDSTELKRVGVLTVSTVLSSINETQFSNEILLSYITGFMKRKSQVIAFLQNKLQNLQKKSANYVELSILERLCDTFFDNEKEKVRSIKNHFKNFNEELLEFVESELNHTKNEINKLTPKSETSSNIKIDELYLKKIERKWKGPFNISEIFSLLNKEKEQENILKEEEKSLIKFIQSSYFGGSVLELINLINNRRTLLDILVNYTLAFYNIPELSAIENFFKYLKSKELIKLS